jgi:hypothetical protein
MAKKKAKQVVAVKKPKIGEHYLFTFAGGTLLGTLDSKCEKLEEHYKEPWFWMRVPETNMDAKRKSGKDYVRYPVSIYSILKVAEPGERYIQK